ncbi:MAG: glycosyltransferase [Clostridium sp.]|nr:glycosyltransferase [Clostridium sp.]
MKRIIIISELVGGGVEKVNRLLAENLNHEKYDILFVSIRGIEISNKYNLNFKYISLNCSKQSKAFFKILKVFSEFSPDIIITCGSYDTYFSILYSRLIQKSCKSIYVHHSVYSTNLVKKRGFKKIIHHYIPKLINLYNMFDKVVSVSYGAKDDLLEYFKIDKEKITVIYNPIIDENIKIKRIGNRLESNSLITIGRVEEEKDQLTILKAIKYLIDRGEEYYLKILGEGSLKKKLMQASEDMGIQNYVEFLGYKDDIYYELSKSDIFILSSKHESFGNVIIEAMYSEVPVISTDCLYGPKEIIKNDEYGILFHIGDYEGLAEKILFLNNIDKSNLINNAKNYSLKFTVNNSVKEYQKLLDLL